jgi:hypothetical protein
VYKAGLLELLEKENSDHHKPDGYLDLLRVACRCYMLIHPYLYPNYFILIWFLFHLSKLIWSNIVCHLIFSTPFDNETVLPRIICIAIALVSHGKHLNHIFMLLLAPIVQFNLGKNFPICYLYLRNNGSCWMKVSLLTFQRAHVLDDDLNNCLGYIISDQINFQRSELHDDDLNCSIQYDQTDKCGT